MREPLTIAVAQPFVVSYDVVANVAAHARIVRTAGAGVVVFPEMSLTGYVFDAPALDPGDARLEPLARACAEAGAVALAGAPVPGAAGAAHIGILAVGPRGADVAYRKMWLGEAEAERFAPGAAPALVEVGGWRIGLAVCKDTGVPEHAAATAALGIDVYAAGVLETPDRSGIQDERARRVAADHHVWVAMAAYAGSTGEGYDQAAGRSGIWAPGGAPVVQAGPEIGAVVTATLADRAGAAG